MEKDPPKQVYLQSVLVRVYPPLILFKMHLDLNLLKFKSESTLFAYFKEALSVLYYCVVTKWWHKIVLEDWCLTFFSLVMIK